MASTNDLIKQSNNSFSKHHSTGVYDVVVVVVVAVLAD